MKNSLQVLSAMTAILSVTGCMTGEASEVESTSQAILPGVATTCASGGLEGDVMPERFTTAPWTQVEGSTTGTTQTNGGQIVVSQSGATGVTFTRVEARTATATNLMLDVNVAIQADTVSTDAACPTVPTANAGIVVADGTRMATLAIGRTRNAAGVETNYIAIRSLDRCAPALATATFVGNLAEHHVYSLRLDVNTGASVFIDKDPAVALHVAYGALDAATAMHGAQYGFRTERAVANWDYVRYSGCGVPAVVATPTVSVCGGAPCPGNHPPSCSHAAASQTILWPPNHSFRPERIVGLTDSDGDEVAYTIDTVTSDEPNDAQGGDDTAADVGWEDQDQNEDGQPHVAGDGHSHGRGVELRAERSGSGNGRVYALHVTANDGHGGTCQATVQVNVPHDHSDDPSVDDGQIYVVSTPLAPPPSSTPTAPGTLRCPAPSRALAGSPVTLRTTGAASATRVRWSVTTAPSSTRAYRFASVYDDADVGAMVGSGTEVPFTSVIVGDFTVHAEAVYANGAIDQCDTTVSMLGHGLRIELSWNTQNTDVDLHGLGDASSRWFSSQDCYYANRRPDSALPTASRRWLDTDDTDGEGPENIRVDSPVTDHEYQVGVHFYSSHGQHSPTHATVVIYCGEQRMGTYERDLTGDRSGPDANDFWNVAAVRFDPSSACSVRTIGRLTTATVVRNGG